MKILVRAFALLALASLTFAGQQQITWVPPIFYVDGSPLLEQDLDYYTVYCDGLAIQVIDSIIGTNTATVNFPEEVGTHVCTLRVTTLAGIESADSNEYVFTNQLPTPTPPVVDWAAM